MANYVKFVRGNLAAYNALVTKDPNTLYFITDSENKTNLYLGETTISSSASSLSPEAQAFLNNLPAANEINDGELQVWVGPEEVEKIDSETGEAIIDPETGEPETETIPGHWYTKSIDDLIPLFTAAATGGAGLVPKPAAADTEKYLRGDGQWVALDETVIQNVITQIVGEGQLNEQFDTLKEISDWILNDTTGAAALQSRLVALEQAVGTGQTEEVEQPAVDDQGNPIYEQLVDEESGKSQYLDIDPENTNTVLLSELEEGQPIYPAYEENPDGNDPPYVPIVDSETGEQKYWDLENEPNLIDEDDENVEGKPPAFIQATETVETEVPNDVEIIKAVIGNLDTLYPQIQQAQIGTLDDRINDLNSRFQAIETILIGQDAQSIQIVPIGSLDMLTENLYTQDDQGNDTTSIVNALNLLDERMQWQGIPTEELNP